MHHVASLLIPNLFSGSEYKPRNCRFQIGKLLRCDICTRLLRHFKLTIGAGHYPDQPKPDVCFDGKGSVGMSHLSIGISYNRDPESVIVEVHNKGGISVLRIDGTRDELAKGQTSLLFQGDKIVYKGAKTQEKLLLLLCGGPVKDAMKHAALSKVESTSEDTAVTQSSMPTDSALQSLQCRAQTSIAHAVASLQNAERGVLEAAETKAFHSAINVLSTALTATLQTLPRQDKSNVLSDLSNTSGTFKNENDLAKRKRHITIEESVNHQPKRSNVDSQERRKFQMLQRKVRTALAVVKKPVQPNQHHKKKLQQTRREAERVLADAGHTRCYFDKTGSCREGTHCPFLDQLPDSTNGNLAGSIFKWVSS
jgi:hypothetical protein